MRDRMLRITAIGVALLMLAAACSSHKKHAQAGGTPVTNPNGTPATNSDGTQKTTPGPRATNPNGTPAPVPGGTPVTNANGTPVTNPNGTSVTTPFDPTTVPGQTTVTTASTSPPTRTTTTTTAGPPVTQKKYYLQWKLAFDFRQHPNVNPFPNQLGGPPVWSLRESRGLQRDGNYPLLPTYTSGFGSSSVDAWHADSSGCHKAPAAGVNTVDAPGSLCGASIPGNAAWLYPAKTQMAVIGWSSNFDGTVNIHPAISNFDRACGDGVDFYIDRGTTNLTYVRLNSIDSRVLPLITTPVNKGESLYFIVDAGPAGNNDCDATQLQIEIDRINT